MIIERDRWLSELHAYAGQEPIEFLRDCYIATDTSPVDTTTVRPSGVGFCCAVIDASENDDFTVYGCGGGAPRLWCFISSDGTILSHADEQTIAYGTIITAPENTAKVIFNINPSGIDDEWMVYRGRLPKSLNTFQYDNIYRAALNPLERNIFVGHKKNLIINTGYNTRVADVVRNSFYSEGHSLATGASIKSIVITCDDLPVNNDMTIKSFDGWKKSYFRSINTGFSTPYLYLHIDRYLNLNGATTGVKIVVATYNSSGIVSRSLLNTALAGYSSLWYKMPDDILTNGNICIIVTPMNTKVTIDIRFQLEITNVLRSDTSNYPDLENTGKTAADN